MKEYEANTTLRQGMLARCDNDPGTLKSSPDCVNVWAAARSVDVGNLRQLPPLKLPENKPR